MKQKTKFVIEWERRWSEAERGPVNMAELCRMLGISRQTGYKLVNRYRQAQHSLDAVGSRRAAQRRAGQRRAARGGRLAAGGSAAGGRLAWGGSAAGGRLAWGGSAAGGSAAGGSRGAARGGRLAAVASRRAARGGRLAAGGSRGPRRGPRRRGRHREVVATTASLGRLPPS
jgi:hypothetical protein